MSEKRKVLVLYVYDNQHELVEAAADIMSSKGVDIDILCVTTYRYRKSTKIQWPWMVYLAYYFINILKISKFYGLVNRLFDDRLIKCLIKKYDVIDFQSFPSFQYKLAIYCKQIGKKYLIAFWGSDILRASDEDLIKALEPLNYSSSIRLNLQMRDKLNVICAQNGYSLEEKYTGAVKGIRTGHKDISIIDGLKDSDFKEGYRLFKSENNDKLLVTVGYNGSLSQNHIKILEIMANLPAEAKERMHLVIPMTYGTPVGYKEKIERIVSNSGISYIILDHFMTNQEVCILRAINNIFVMMQDSDGFAASVRAHLYCQNVCFFGEWLNYSKAADGIYYLKVNWDDLQRKLEDVIMNFEQYHDKSLINKEKMIPLMRWDNYVKLMLNLYK